MRLKKLITLGTIIALFISLTAFELKKSFAPNELIKSVEKKWPGAKLIQHNEGGHQHLIFYNISHNNKTVAKAYTNRVISCRAGGCCKSNTENDDSSSEYFDYYALLSGSNSIIEVKVYNYQATHGEEICSKNWLKQFKGYDGSNKLRFGKEVDGVSGATISAQAITQDIEKIVKQINQK